MLGYSVPVPTYAFLLICLSHRAPWNEQVGIQETQNFHTPDYVTKEFAKEKAREARTNSTANSRSMGKRMPRDNRAKAIQGAGFIMGVDSKGCGEEHQEAHE